VLAVNWGRPTLGIIVTFSTYAADTVAYDDAVSRGTYLVDSWLPLLDEQVKSFRASGDTHQVRVCEARIRRAEAELEAILVSLT
jgi:hypothetical protein